MREQQRIERILELLAAVWPLYPDLRLGQLLENSLYFDPRTGYTGERVVSAPVYMVEDHTIEDGLKGILLHHEGGGK